MWMISVNVWLYIFDEFRPLDIEPPTLFKLAREDPLRLFNMVREVLEEYIKEIRGVEVRRVFYDFGRFELLIEYIVTCEAGIISAKLIYSENPTKTLQHFYESESHTA